MPNLGLMKLCSRHLIFFFQGVIYGHFLGMHCVDSRILRLTMCRKRIAIAQMAHGQMR